MQIQPLAVIGRITATRPIPGADLIHQVEADCRSAGTWTGVAGNGITVGARVLVFLQDALLPPDPRWIFMEQRGYRVKMARFKGVPSECVVLDADACAVPGEPGEDVAALLGVTKYSKPIPTGMAGDAAGAFPVYIPKTDEPNWQTVPEMVARMATEHWYASEKADGTSCTAWVDDAGLHVCSRNWELREHTASGASNVYWQTARKYGLERLPRGSALQFEIVGPGIQGNPMGLEALEMRAFSLYDIEGRRYHSAHGMASVCHTLGLPMARRISAEQGRDYTPDELRTLAAIKYPNGKHGEGIVIRARDSSWSFKVINLNYRS